jgi:hypothetical protein
MFESLNKLIIILPLTLDDKNPVKFTITLNKILNTFYVMHINQI